MTSRSPALAIPPETLAETRRLVIAWWIALAVLIGGTITWIVLVQPPNHGWIWGQIVGLAALPGKFLIFTALIPESPLGPWEVAVLAVATDVAMALTLAVGLGWIMRFPAFADSLKSVHDKAQKVLAEFPRLRRMAFWGVVFFVFLPLPASGAIGGTFLGQLLGLTRTMGAIAVIAGGALVSAVFAGLATFMGARASEFFESWWVKGISLALFALIAWVLWLRIRVALKKK
jgi:uncharacterized membrane protein